MLEIRYWILVLRVRYWMLDVGDQVLDIGAEG
jgi:hypothetical protein